MPYFVRERFFEERDDIRIEAASHPDLRPIDPDRAELSSVIDLQDSGNRSRLGRDHIPLSYAPAPSD